MPVKLSNFKTKTTFSSTDQLVGYTDTNAGGEARWTHQTLKQSVQNFVPYNYSTRSNAFNVSSLASWSDKDNNRSSTNPWFSGVQTVNINRHSNAPTNTIGAIINVRANVNAYENNGQRLYIYKPSEESTVFGGATAPREGLLTKAIQDKLNGNFLKGTIDPTGGKNVMYEGDYYGTHVVYTDDNIFRWFWVDNRSRRPTAAPEYSVQLSIVGFVVQT